MRVAGIEIGRIRCDAEGLLAQAVKIENHSLPPRMDTGSLRGEGGERKVQRFQPEALQELRSTVRDTRCYW